MSASPDVMTQLIQSLQAGLGGQGTPQPTQQGGLMGAINAALAPYGGAGGLGIALMGNTSGATAPGAALTQGMQNAQQTQLKNTQMGLQNAASAQDLLMNNMKMRMFASAYPQWLQMLNGGQPGSQAPQQGAPSSMGAFDTSSGPALPPSAAAAPPAGPSGPSSGAPSGAGSGYSYMRAGMVGAAMGMPGADQMLKYGQTLLENDPQQATKMAVAKSEASQDLAMLSQFSGNPGMQQAAYIKLLKDMGLVTVDRYGNVVTMGGVQPNSLGVNTFLPQQGVQTTNGVMSPIPGATGTRQALAGAEAVGKAQGDVQEVTDSNGNKYYVPRSVLLGGAPGAAGGAASGGGNTPFMASVGPAASELLKGKGEQAAEVNKEFQGKAEGAQQMLAQIAELKSAATDFTPGQFAEGRMKMLQWLQSTDLITKDEANSLGSAQAGTKIAIQLQAAATKQLGSREAAQVFQIMGKSLPNLTLSPDGLSKVSAYMEGMARYDIARAQVAQHRMASNDVNGLNATRDDFIKNTNPTYYIFAAADPATRAEMLQSLGPKAQSFLQQWNDAANAGWAPRPGSYQ